MGEPDKVLIKAHYGVRCSGAWVRSTNEVLQLPELTQAAELIAAAKTKIEKMMADNVVIEYVHGELKAVQLDVSVGDTVTLKDERSGVVTAVTETHIMLEVAILQDGEYTGEFDPPCEVTRKSIIAVEPA